MKTKISASLRRAWRFFHEHVAHSVPPGKAASALAYARAERRARLACWRYEWVDDIDGMPEDGLCTCGCGYHIERSEGCVLTDEDGNDLASLWGVWDADANYRRVVEAELALQVESEGASRTTRRDFDPEAVADGVAEAERTSFLLEASDWLEEVGRAEEAEGLRLVAERGWWPNVSVNHPGEFYWCASNIGFNHYTLPVVTAARLGGTLRGASHYYGDVWSALIDLATNEVRSQCTR